MKKITLKELKKYFAENGLSEDTPIVVKDNVDWEVPVVSDFSVSNEKGVVTIKAPHNYDGVECDGFESAWKDIEESFDWEKVRSVMASLDWRWWRTVGGEYEVGVPDVERIKSTAKELLQNVHEHFLSNMSEDVHECSTGGLKAYCYLDKYKSVVLGLLFVLEECEHFKDE